jgi:death-on-curing protein
MNLIEYEPDSDLCALAASYAFGIARNHPFSDGNKRVAFQATYVFLGLNRLRVQSEEPEVVRVMLALASGELRENGLADWLRAHIIARA